MSVHTSSAVIVLAFTCFLLMWNPTESALLPPTIPTPCFENTLVAKAYACAQAYENSVSDRSVIKTVQPTCCKVILEADHDICVKFVFSNLISGHVYGDIINYCANDVNFPPPTPANDAPPMAPAPPAQN